MPALFIYLIKVNIALLIFCLGYYAVLRHLTFYTLNRIYLVTAIVFSTLYPKVDLTAFLNQHEQMQVVIVNWQGPVKAIAQSAWHDQWFWLQLVFWTGVALFSIRLLTQLLSLYRLHKKSEPAQIRHYMIRAISGNVNPFSFWRSIYINPANHPANELDAILEHEQIHVNEWHTLDILLGEISAIFYWFNPGIWLMKKAIRENIEFITDRKILLKGVDSKSYQYSLINVNFGAQNNAIVNHFNISTIKKRIIMMNAKRSSSVNITRYVFLIPMVMVLLLVFSVSKAELSKSVTKSSASVMRVLKAAVTKINFTVEKVTAPGRKPAPVLSAVSSFIIQNDTLIKTTGKISVPDTIKTFKLIIKDVNNGSTEPDIYIDGVKTTTGLSGIDPDNVATINVMKSLSTAPNGAVYIVTKDHAPGTVSSTFLFDTDTLKNIKGKVTNVIIRGNGAKQPLKTLRINGVKYDPDKMDKTVVNGDTVYVTNLPALTITKSTQGKGVKSKAALTMIAPANFTFKDSTTSNGSGNITVSAYGTSSGGVRITGGKSTGHALTIHPAPINLTDKLIIIDGKVASANEFKQLSASKIATINNLMPEQATAKYGDKAKNGAVLITTKK